MAAAVLNSQVFNDFLCSQFCPFSAFSASRRGSVARSVSPPQRGVVSPRTGAGRPGVVPEFKAWLASLSTKTLYRHLLESLNFANGDDGLVEELAPSQLDLALAATDDTGFDAHLAEALGEEEMSDHCSSSSEEDDENNEAVS